MQNTPYKIIMSRGDDIQINTDELVNVLKAISSGQPAIFKTGMFNPSFFVSLVEDKERKSWYSSEVPKLKSIFSDDNLKLEGKDKRLS